MKDGFTVPKSRIVTHDNYSARIPKIVSVRLEGRKVIATLECGHESVLFTVPKKRTTCYSCPAKKTQKTEVYHGHKVIPLATDKVQ